MTQTPFDPKRARAKAPFPVFVDALMRDTMGLLAEEFGCYMRLLMAMWSTEGLCLPDDDRRLAAIARVDIRSWKARIGPALRPLLQAQDGVIWSRKMREVARFTERQLAAQSARRRGSDKNVTDFVTHTPVEIYTDTHADENADLSSKPLETHKPTISADISTDTTTDHSAEASTDRPYQYTNSKKEEEGVRVRASSEFSSSKDPFLDRIVEAVGLTPGSAPRYWTGKAAAQHVRGWITANGLTEADVIAEAKHSRTRNPEPPDGPKALDVWMRQAGIAKRAAEAQGTGKAQATTAPAKPPISPEERLKFFADWVKDLSRPMAGSVISNTLRDSLLQAGLVDKADLRARGVY